MIKEAIKEAMKEGNINQQKIADHLGISRQAVSQYLSGKYKLSIENIEKILEYLNLRIKKEQP